MTHAWTRRTFIKATAAAGATAAVASHALAAPAEKTKPLFTISLAEWSFHRALFGGKLDHLDFAKVAKQEYDIHAVEYVNQFFKDKAEDKKYLGEMKQRADDLGVKSALIMIDNEGKLGAADSKERKEAVAKHHKWVEAGKFLGCHSIRVNLHGDGSYEEHQKQSTDGLRQLCEFAQPTGLNVIVENHGGHSSNGKWLAKVIKDVGLKNCGTLPDFGNFATSGPDAYDRYKGVEEMMPYAKAVSAKSHDFDDKGEETTIDYRKMMKIVLAAGYHGNLGIEYEGDRMSEPEGVKATLKLLLKVRDELGQSG